jgi:hypothetical protein
MMCPDDRAVDHVGAGIALHRASQRLQHGIEYAGGCPAPVATARSVPIPRPADQSARPTPPPKSSLESIRNQPVNLCPRGLVKHCREDDD